jgi:heme/copper-type cytochrome/quinol oxidase subunit 2
VPASLSTPLLSALGAATAGVHGLWASGQTDLQQTDALVWIMIAISAVGAIITFAFLTYALWKYRDPKVKNRRYG